MNHRRHTVDQQTVFGCSFDGLKDRYCAAGEKNLHGETYRLADVILPSNPFGQLLTGQQAAESRLSSGLSWPPEAQVSLERSLHRVPVSWAWRLLVDAGDKSVRWSVGRDGSFPLPRILATHIAGCLREAGNAWDSVVIAIPNELDEFGQDGFLRALRDLKIQGFQQEKVRLIWRPVAAALAWLEHTQDALLGDIPPDDFIIVVHLGPDCMEFVPFRLKRSPRDKRYVVPLREPPTANKCPTKSFLVKCSPVLRTIVCHICDTSPSTSGAVSVRYVRTLTESQRHTLETLMKHDPSPRARARAHSILLSARRVTIKEIVKIYQVDRDTVSSWIKKWEQTGVESLYDKPRSGRPSKLTQEEKELAQHYIQEEPRCLKQVAERLSQKTAKRLSISSLKRRLVSAPS